MGDATEDVCDRFGLVATPLSNQQRFRLLKTVELLRTSRGAALDANPLELEAWFDRLAPTSFVCLRSGHHSTAFTFSGLEPVAFRDLDDYMRQTAHQSEEEWVAAPDGRWAVLFNVSHTDLYGKGPWGFERPD